MTDPTPTDPAALSAEVERLRKAGRQLIAFTRERTYLDKSDRIKMQEFDQVFATTHPEGRD